MQISRHCQAPASLLDQQSAAAWLRLLRAFCRDVLESETNAMFLDGARIHLACCAPKEQMELVRICREGAATRHVDLLPAVTHIVVRVACCTPLSGRVKQRGWRPAAVGCHKPCRAPPLQVGAETRLQGTCCSACCWLAVRAAAKSTSRHAVVRGAKGNFGC